MDGFRDSVVATGHAAAFVFSVRACQRSGGRSASLSAGGCGTLLVLHPAGNSTGESVASFSFHQTLDFKRGKVGQLVGHAEDKAFIEIVAGRLVVMLPHIPEVIVMHAAAVHFSRQMILKRHGVLKWDSAIQVMLPARSAVNDPLKMCFADAGIPELAGIGNLTRGAMPLVSDNRHFYCCDCVHACLRACLQRVATINPVNNACKGESQGIKAVHGRWRDFFISDRNETIDR